MNFGSGLYHGDGGVPNGGFGVQWAPMTFHPLRIAILHASVTLTAVPMESVLNRVLMQEMGLSALVAALILSIPFLLAPVTLFLGPVYDRRRAAGKSALPPMALGYLLLGAAVALTPYALMLFEHHRPLALLALAGLMTVWGLGFHGATVGYFTIASRRAGGKGGVVASMFVVMVAAIIPTSIALSHALDPFSLDAMARSFRVTALVALGMAALALPFLERALGTEGRVAAPPAGSPWALLRNGSHRLFFIYLLFLLSALLGQDLMLEPCGAQVFGLSVAKTTRLPSYWGAAFLVTLVLGAWLERRMPREPLIQWGGWMAFAGLLGLAVAAWTGRLPLFHPSIMLLGLGTGLATVTNLGWMLGRREAGLAGTFMGLWALAETLARAMGNIGNGILVDLGKASGLTVGQAYGSVWLFGAGLLFLSLWIFRRLRGDGMDASSPPGPPR